MLRYEFKVVPAPKRGEKARGVKTTEDRFALALANLMNEYGRDGWDYVRADALPVDERVGFTGTKTTYHNMLVFRRPLDVSEGEASVPAPIRMVVTEPAPVAPRLGPAEPPAGPAPALGPASSAGLAAE